MRSVRISQVANALWLICFTASTVTAIDRPNVVLIMTDNHGAWTLGCYGNQDIRTPNIDALASQGMLMTRAFASNPVCSPTRATFLTGLIPSQHGVHCFLAGGGLQTGPEARSTLDQVTSLPEVLSGAGYSCGLVGKWHLGGNLHSQEGFNDYWVTMPHGGTSTFYGAQVIENGQIREEPQYLTDFWTEHAVNFISNNAPSDKPFFLFLAYNGPYSLSRLLLREGRNRHATYYADKELLSFPREPTHPWQMHNRDFSNNATSIRRVATEVSGIDDGVGTVMSALRQHGLDDNTIVVFVADQGWVGGHGGFFGMGDHTRPVTARDGMMRIPMIWRFPKKILAGSVSDAMVTNYDFMPTLLNVLGLGDKMPEQPKSPGQDFSRLLLNDSSLADNSSIDSDQPVYYEFEGLRCIRTPNWKYIHRHANGPHELYNLANDPDEFDNLVDRAEHQTTRDKLKLQLDNFFNEYAVPKYDMWRGGGSQARTHVGVDEEIAQLASVQPPPLSADFQPAELSVPDGFTAELAAGPPLVQHPTFATFDDSGRLFISENAGVNLSAAELETQLPNSIRLLEDLDHDGRFDTSKVFADKMTFPMGGAWHDGALYVASPPNIWRLQDTDNDGIADRRDILVNRFGFTGNAASIHGPVSGPDGRLYWCDGYHGHEFRDAEGNITSKREGSYIFSCLPSGADVRIHCGGGMDNPVEVDFTNEGEMLGSVNILYTRPRVDCLVHWLYGGVYPHRERILMETKTTGDLLGPIHRFGHVAVSGIARYRSGTIDHRWRDNVFATFFNSGKVVRLETERHGATFNVTQREFLASSSREFHPTDVVEDADGSLLVVDTGGWFYRGCPTSQFAKPDILGGIYRVRRQGMTPQIDPRGLKIGWNSLTNEQLIRLLGDTRHAVREQAINQCAKRGETIVDELVSAVKRRDFLYRMGAIWALTRIIGERDLSAARVGIRAGLADSVASIRQLACHSLATYPDPGASNTLQEMLGDREPAVRREAATAMGRLGDASAIPALLAAVDNEIDRAEEHAIIYALIEINRADTTRIGLHSDRPRIGKAALIALDQMDESNLNVNDVLPLIESEDESLQRAAASVFVSHSDWSEFVAETIKRLLRRDDQQSVDIAKQLITRFLNHPSVASLVGRELENFAGNPKHQAFLLAAIAASHGAVADANWAAPIAALLADPQAETIQATLAAISAIDSKPFKKDLERLGNDLSKPKLLRAIAIQLASGNAPNLDDSTLQLLMQIMNTGSAVDSAIAAQRIGSSKLTKQQMQQVVVQLENAGPTQLRELLRLFERSRDDEVGRQFLDTMTKARSLTSLSHPEFSDVIKNFPPELLPAANELLGRIRQEEEKKLAKLDRLLPLLRDGDMIRGKELFFAEKTKCASCHRVHQQGGNIGPDLTNIGAVRASRDLLESIVFPSSTIVREYEPRSVLTSGGSAFSGIISRETAETVFIQQATGEPLGIAQDDIVEVVASPVSIMPSGLEDVLNESELADIVAYLQSCKE